MHAYWHRILRFVVHHEAQSPLWQSAAHTRHKMNAAASQSCANTVKTSTNAPPACPGSSDPSMHSQHGFKLWAELQAERSQQRRQALAAAAKDAKLGQLRGNMQQLEAKLIHALQAENAR